MNPLPIQLLILVPDPMGLPQASGGDRSGDGGHTAAAVAVVVVVVDVVVVDVCVVV